MDELFNILSSSARLDKSKRPKKRVREEEEEEEEIEDVSDQEPEEAEQGKSRDRTGKRDTTEGKRDQVHREEIAAFRRSMKIKLVNKHDPDLPDPVASFEEMEAPAWWKSADTSNWRGVKRAVLRNIEMGRWKEPTAIQMQSIPALFARRDYIGAAPTGSGKSGAFIVPALVLTSCPHSIYYEQQASSSQKSKKKKKGKSSTKEENIRSLLLAPSLELASQLHREVERLGVGKPGGLSSLLLSKTNSANLIAGNLGGKGGIDILVSTPLRLVDAIGKGLRLDSVRLLVLDEADRLLDATDGSNKVVQSKETQSKESFEEETEESAVEATSGSTQSQTFLSQIDTILNAVPASAIRALFSATVTPMVRSLAESILRNPVDVSITATGSQGGANQDISQELMFVGKEEGKLLAVRQLVQRGDLRPPVIIFLQSQDRAQALFEELLYDNIRVDVIHAGRSKAAREKAVAMFRKGETWVLICTDLMGRGVDFRAVNMVINYDLPASGVSYVHRIGRTGRAGRKGRAITFFTEADFESLRAIANVMKQSGCDVPDWMLNLKKKRQDKMTVYRGGIDTTPSYDKTKKHKRKQMIEHSKRRKEKPSSESKT